MSSAVVSSASAILARSRKASRCSSLKLWGTRSRTPNVPSAYPSGDKQRLARVETDVRLARDQRIVVKAFVQARVRDDEGAFRIEDRVRARERRRAEAPCNPAPAAI